MPSQTLYKVADQKVKTGDVGFVDHQTLKAIKYEKSQPGGVGWTEPGDVLFLICSSFAQEQLQPAWWSGR